MMTPTTLTRADPQPDATHQRHDPVLAELWEIKARMNAEAGYDVKQLLANAHKEVQAMKAAGLLVARETS